jgi:hypothetical protein
LKPVGSDGEKVEIIGRSAKMAKNDLITWAGIEDDDDENTKKRKCAETLYALEQWTRRTLLRLSRKPKHRRLSGMRGK